MKPEIQFYNRYSGELETEKIYGEAYLRWLYEKPAGALLLNALVKKKVFSQFYGWRMNRPSSRQKIAPFIEQYGVDTSEFIDPVSSFRHFNDFFYRRLKPASRPINKTPGNLIFPADGRHLLVPIDLQKSVPVKGNMWNWSELWHHLPEWENTFDGGHALVSRLCPVDYHRFHWPQSGKTGETLRVPGPLFSVNPLATSRHLSIFWKNERTLTLLQTPHSGSIGLLEVGATCVGGIHQTFAPGTTVYQGDEKGYFSFGGSCIITLVEKNRFSFAPELTEWSGKGIETYGRMGDQCATPSSCIH